eukprot:TRINITY_DN355_c0_g1_i3.p1 TRINITY_DN355_c0_g1~~TRINITY_DN355_c0_g1_i3.p1  ORF type:complete len:513 (+),score=159.31 TRINITY_DN355_c0_g1_i3:2014-3552(+)
MSWGSWGWDVLQNTVSAVSETTTILLNDLAEVIDVPEDEMPREEPEQEKKEQPETTAEEGTTAFAYRSPILGALTAGATVLGNALQKGVEVVQTTDVSNIDFEALGEGIAGAFERVGESAFAVLGTEVGPADKPQAGSEGLVSGDKTATQVELICHLISVLLFPLISFICSCISISLSSSCIFLTVQGVKTVLEVFEELSGKETLATLEQLSIQSMMGTQKVYRQLSFEDREEVDDATTEMEQILESEEEFTTAPSLSEEVEFEGLKYFLEETQDLKRGLKLKETLEEAKQKIQVKENNHQDVYQASKNAVQELNKVHVETIGNKTASALKIYLSFAEWVQKDTPATDSEVASFLSYLDSTFNNELKEASKAFESAISTVESETVKALESCQIQPVEGQEASEEDKKEFLEKANTIQKELLEENDKLKVSISAQVDTAASQLASAKQFLTSLCKARIVTKKGKTEHASEHDKSTETASEPSESVTEQSESAPEQSESAPEQAEAIAEPSEAQ